VGWWWLLTWPIGALILLRPVVLYFQDKLDEDKRKYLVSEPTTLGGKYGPEITVILFWWPFALLVLAVVYIARFLWHYVFFPNGVLSKQQREQLRQDRRASAKNKVVEDIMRHVAKDLRQQAEDDLYHRRLMDRAVAAKQRDLDSATQLVLDALQPLPLDDDGPPPVYPPGIRTIRG
jgi:hypothetical protein